MKKLIVMVLIICGIKANAQVAVLEATYDSAATWNNPLSLQSQLMLVNFEVSGQQYVFVNRAGGYIGIYSLNHALVKTISLAGFPGNFIYGDFLYFTEQLFDPDNKKEFMYIVPVTTPGGDATYLTQIYNEDGALLFSDSGAALIHPNFPLQQYPIYNTPQGTKMILSYPTTGQAKVFSLRGTLPCTNPCSISNFAGISPVGTNYSGMLSNPYPNPSANGATINYTLPDGVNTGEILFYDLQGREIKRFKVDRTFSKLEVSTTDIASGTYYYQLITNGHNTTARKMVVIK